MMTVSHCFVPAKITVCNCSAIELDCDIKVNLDCKEKILHKILRSINKTTTEPKEKTTSTTTIKKIRVTKLKYKNESQTTN